MSSLSFWHRVDEIMNNYSMPMSLDFWMNYSVLIILSLAREMFSRYMSADTLKSVSLTWTSWRGTVLSLRSCISWREFYSIWLQLLRRSKEVFFPSMDSFTTFLTWSIETSSDGDTLLSLLRNSSQFFLRSHLCLSLLYGRLLSVEGCLSICF